MEFYECLQLHNWKQLTDEEKTEIFAGVIKFFLNPRLTLDWQRLVNFEMCGMKCRTFELMINGEVFVFIPGQKEVVLGWDFGSQGLRSQDLLKDWAIEDEQVYGTSLTVADLPDLRAKLTEEMEGYDFRFLEDIDQYINQQTSRLRKVDIQPMIVAKNSQPVGTNLRGSYSLVSGQFVGDQAFFAEYQEEIARIFNPDLSLAESLTWTYPVSVFKVDHYYLEQRHDDPDSYHVFEHQDCNYGELWLVLHRHGFQLLSEDAWEYAVGGGTRRLFRWGNDIQLETSHPFESALEKLGRENMFGVIQPDELNHYELTDNSDTLKLEIQSRKGRHLIEQILPFSSYYQPQHQFALNEKLDPRFYHYRKSIVIDPN